MKYHILSRYTKLQAKASNKKSIHANLVKSLKQLLRIVTAKRRLKANNTSLLSLFRCIFYCFVDNSLRFTS